MKICIIGGGLTGLSAAFKLSKKGHEVTILEKENFLGGLASSFEIEWNGKKYSIASCYHHILEGDETTIKIINEFGLRNKLHKKRVKLGFLYKNKIKSILSLNIPLIEKLKIGKFVLKCNLKRNWEDVKENAEEYISREAGKKNYEILFKKLIYNKFGIDGSKISAAWFCSRFAKESRSFLKKFGWLEGGISQIVNGFARRIEENGGKIIKNAEVKKIEFENETARKVFFKNESESFDLIISTIAPEAFLKLNENFPKLYPKLKEIKYLPVICTTFGLSKNLTDFYWINILDDLECSAIFCNSNLYEDVCPKGKSVMYIVKYLNAENPFWKKEDEEIEKKFEEEGDIVFGEFSENVEWKKTFRNRYAVPLFHANYKNPPMRGHLKNVYFAGISRIYPKVRNMASAIESGFEVAGSIS